MLVEICENMESANTIHLIGTQKIHRYNRQMSEKVSKPADKFDDEYCQRIHVLVSHTLQWISIYRDSSIQLQYYEYISINHSVTRTYP